MTATKKPNSILYRSKVEYTTEPGVYAMNHVVGCPHGCVYCYAYKMARRFGTVDSYTTWKQPRLISDWRERLEHDLAKRHREPIRRVFLSFMTDPFPYTPGLHHDFDYIADATLEAIRILNEHDIPVTTLTKGIYPAEKLANMHPDNEYGITMISTAVNAAHELEPYAAPLSARFSAMLSLAAADCRTWCSIEPFGLIHPDEDNPYHEINRILSLLNFTDRIVFGRGNYTKLAYKGDEWYAECAEIVREYGARHGIEVIIKKGTPTRESIQAAQGGEK